MITLAADPVVGLRLALVVMPKQPTSLIFITQTVFCVMLHVEVFLLQAERKQMVGVASKIDTICTHRGLLGIPEYPICFSLSYPFSLFTSKIFLPTETGKQRSAQRYAALYLVDRGPPS